MGHDFGKPARISAHSASSNPSSETSSEAAKADTRSVRTRMCFALFVASPIILSIEEPVVKNPAAALHDRTDAGALRIVLLFAEMDATRNTRRKLRVNTRAIALA